MKAIYLLPAIVLCSVNVSWGQSARVELSGQIKDAADQADLPFANVVLLKDKDSTFVAGTVTNEKGRYSLPAVPSGKYLLRVTYSGYETVTKPATVGHLSPNLDLGTIELRAGRQLAEVTVTGNQTGISEKMDRKSFNLADNLTQTGASVLDALRNLPGVTLSEGKVLLRGSDKVAVLVDGKQTALTGFGGQESLGNIPASAIEKVEIINNPSARYDANGNAGIINLVFKKEKKEGLNGKIGLSVGAGALWVRKQNLPDIRPQYTATPKLNPSVSLNYRKKKMNVFLQADNLFTRTLNKNEFVDRYYDDGQIIRQQTKRNRTTNIVTVRTGMDWSIDPKNTLSVSGLFSSEKILDRGDEPFFNGDLSQRQRLWQFLEDELKTTATGTATWQRRFDQPGRQLNAGLNYTYHRENEKYFFDNIMPSFTGKDAFKLLSDEQVLDATVDYVQPLRRGRIEGGVKLRRRTIPTDMHFIPGLNSPLDTTAGGWANYRETIPAVYGNYVFESDRVELEAGVRVEYVRVDYDVNPNHPTYKSASYSYTQPFPNLRLAYKFNETDRLSFFYNRRVDRPNEVDIRIFPKYDDAEIIKVGNPALRPQFTNTYELGYKTGWNKSTLYLAAYHKQMDATITRISSTVNGSTLIYAIFQNAGKSYNTGAELLFTRSLGRKGAISLNLNGYRNVIDAFTVVNKYPVENTFTSEKQELFSGNVKLNGQVSVGKGTDLQVTAIYLAPDLIPQGRIGSRFSVDAGLKKTVGQNEWFLNATDLFNTLRIQKTINGAGFHYTSTDYYETQVIRAGYNYKF
ncbi:outer membrane beta-barrel family protein [Siphonobacter aquaeclarae]|uniref:Outer membrane receptor proteins, mostly Fe transport n=1 Tax=Siphonobacter aquaeclarae TaxID=563176 RepID=A0A1G9Y5Y5_9BACT|nr:outer membrane beta-barrel family protein [Siphonobacter aquaeclarae]SDN03895.1 Outer membrane receptor proteins, mostly Fe transport [Siphonobacter aquaeclarae]